MPDMIPCDFFLVCVLIDKQATSTFSVFAKRYEKIDWGASPCKKFISESRYIFFQITESSSSPFSVRSGLRKLQVGEP